MDSALSGLIQRCLAMDAKDRPTAAEVASTLRKSLRPTPRTKRWLARHPAKAVAAVTLLLAVGLGSIGLAAMRQPYGERQLDSGMRMYREGQYAQAVQHFSEVLRADPGNADALFARGRAYQQLGASDGEKYTLAMNDYMEADKRNPDGRSKAALGCCLNRTKARPQAAIFYYEEAIRAGFATAEVYNDLGFSYLDLLPQEKENARKNLDRAIELDPKMQPAYHNRAYLALSLAHGNKKQLKSGAKESEAYRALKAGIADADKAIELGGASAELYFHAASLCSLAILVDENWAKPAQDHLENALKEGLDPKRCRDAGLAPLGPHAPAFFAGLDRRPAGRPLPPTQRLADPIRGRSLTAQ
jgi:Flp pilus assembly protein TadD